MPVPRASWEALVGLMIMALNSKQYLATTGGKMSGASKFAEQLQFLWRIFLYSHLFSLNTLFGIYEYYDTMALLFIGISPD